MYITYDETLADKFTKRRLALINQVNEIIADYSVQGYTLTLRQLYYQLVSRNIIANEERSYKNLGNAVNDGRMAGMISWLGIEDRGRGIRPWLIEEDEQEVLNGIEDGFALDYWDRQDTYVEVWVEKDALASVIERPCNTWRVPYMPCKGYLSASEAWRAGRRFRRMAAHGRHCVLIHLGDHDPSGIDMTRDNDDRLAIFADEPVEVRRIALNMDQVEQYRPPENPCKLSDTRSGVRPDGSVIPGSYVDLYGRSSWELDALEPRVLHALIESEITSLIDMEVWEATEREETERRHTLAQLHERYYDIKEWLDEQDT
jgi:hypothetical protein